MPLQGFKKTLNKANQFLNEKVAGAKGSDKGNDYKLLTEAMDSYKKYFEDVQAKTIEMLQPNPTVKARMMTVAAISKLQGRPPSTLYPQAEQELADCFSKHGKEIGEDTLYGASLLSSADAFSSVAEAKYRMEDEIKESFLQPAHLSLSNDIKEISHLRKKLESRRLDYDCIRRTREKAQKLSEEDFESAKMKFEESLDHTIQAMANFLDSEPERLSALVSFCNTNYEFHSRAAEIMKSLHTDLEEKLNQASKQANNLNRTRSNFNYSSTSWSSSPFPASASSVSSKSNLSPTSQRKHPSLAGHPSSNESPNCKMSSESNRPTAPMAPLSMAARNTSIPSPPPQTIPYSPPMPTVRFCPRDDSNKLTPVPTCRALYNFEAETAAELNFQENDVILLIEKIDENWFLGEINGRRGHFPVNYVEVLVALPEP